MNSAAPRGVLDLTALALFSAETLRCPHDGSRRLRPAPAGPGLPGAIGAAAAGSHRGSGGCRLRVREGCARRRWWLSDNGSGYIAEQTRRFARDIGFEPRTTPVERPQSNGMAEAFVRTMKRDMSGFSTVSLLSRSMNTVRYGRSWRRFHQGRQRRPWTGRGAPPPCRHSGGRCSRANLDDASIRWVECGKETVHGPSPNCDLSQGALWRLSGGFVSGTKLVPG